MQLTDEHVIPEGLGGDRILPKASCPDCCDLTSRIEHRILRQSHGLRAARSSLGIGKRRKREKPTEAPIETEDSAGRTERPIPLAVHPLLFSLPLLEMPSTMSGRVAPTGVRVRGWHHYSAGPEARVTLAYLGEQKVYGRSRLYDHDFAKLIAIISWCSWVAEYGIKPLAETWLPPVIRGQDEAVGKFVGTLDYALVGLTGAPCLHSVHLGLVKHEGRWLGVARVQLCLQLTPCPTYTAVVGPLREGKFNSIPASQIGRSRVGEQSAALWSGHCRGGSEPCSSGSARKVPAKTLWPNSEPLVLLPR
jgi:hypothetical protein